MLFFKNCFACVLEEPSLLCSSKVTSTLSIGTQWRDSQAALRNLSMQIPEAVAAGPEAG